MGDPHLCSFDYAKPRSYFAVMLGSQAIIEKGVPCIKGDQTDGYYMCLLKLPIGRLKKMPADLAAEPRSDRFFKQLVSDEANDENEVHSEDEVAEAPLVLPDLPM